LTGCALRGGSWFSRSPGFLRAEYRRGIVPVNRFNNIGFRTVLHPQKGLDL